MHPARRICLIAHWGKLIAEFQSWVHPGRLGHVTPTLKPTPGSHTTHLFPLVILACLVWVFQRGARFLFLLCEARNGHNRSIPHALLFLCVILTDLKKGIAICLICRLEDLASYHEKRLPQNNVSTISPQIFFCQY